MIGDKTTEAIILLSVVVASFICGAIFRDWQHECPVPEKEIVTEYQTETKTEIAYVPKETIIERYIDADGNEVTRETTEKTDIDMQLGKQDINIKVNGKEVIVDKADNENFVFDKNKLTLDQTSQANINIEVPTIDKTKRWEIGVGLSNNGVAGMIGFPVKENIGGWVAGDKDTAMGGVMIRF